MYAASAVIKSYIEAYEPSINASELKEIPQVPYICFWIQGFCQTPQPQNKILKRILPLRFSEKPHTK